MSRSSSTSPKTPAQNRRIWATAAQLGLTEEHLRDLVYSVTLQRRISTLTRSQAQRVIHELQGMVVERRSQHLRVGPVSARASRGQIKYIRDLAGQLGWDEWALRAWLKRWWRVQHEDWLTAAHATKAITGLKAMCQAQRRRRVGQEPT